MFGGECWNEATTWEKKEADQILFLLRLGELLKKEIGPEHHHYVYPTYVLDYVRDIAPGDIVGELKGAFHVTLETFCSALELALITSL